MPSAREPAPTATMPSRRRQLLRSLLCLRHLPSAFLVAPLAASAAVPAPVPTRLPAPVSWPRRSVRLVVPAAAGGAIDAFAVPLALALSSRFGQQVTLDHRPGLAGRLGAEIVARSRPDGDTFLLASFDQVIAVGGHAGLAPVTLVALTPAVVLAAAGAPSAGLLLELNRRLRDPSFAAAFSYASSGSASLAGLGAQRYLAAAGAAPAVHRLHRDLRAGLRDLEAGGAQLMIAPLPAALPRIREGRLQALAVTGASRSFALPAVPTLAEVGVDMPPLQDWQALWSPAATPEVIRLSLQQAVAAVLDQQEMVESWNRLGAARGGQPAQVLQLLVQSDALTWGQRSGGSP